MRITALNFSIVSTLLAGLVCAQDGRPVGSKQDNSRTSISTSRSQDSLTNANSRGSSSEEKALIDSQTQWVPKNHSKDRSHIKSEGNSRKAIIQRGGGAIGGG